MMALVLFILPPYVILPNRFSENSSATFKSMWLPSFSIVIMLKKYSLVLRRAQSSHIEQASNTYNYLFRTDGGMCVIESVVFTPLPLSNSVAVLTVSFVEL